MNQPWLRRLAFAVCVACLLPDLALHVASFLRPGLRLNTYTVFFVISPILANLLLRSGRAQPGPGTQGGALEGAFSPRSLRALVRRPETLGVVLMLYAVFLGAATGGPMGYALICAILLFVVTVGIFSEEAELRRTLPPDARHSLFRYWLRGLRPLLVPFVACTAILALVGWPLVWAHHVDLSASGLSAVGLGSCILGISAFVAGRQADGARA